MKELGEISIINPENMKSGQYTEINYIDIASVKGGQILELQKLIQPALCRFRIAYQRLTPEEIDNSVRCNRVKKTLQKINQHELKHVIISIGGQFSLIINNTIHRFGTHSPQEFSQFFNELKNSNVLTFKLEIRTSNPNFQFSS